MAAPVSSSGTVTEGILAGIGTWLGTAALLVAGKGGARKILDRRGLAGWDREWVEFSGREAVLRGRNRSRRGTNLPSPYPAEFAQA